MTEVQIVMTVNKSMFLVYHQMKKFFASLKGITMKPSFVMDNPSGVYATVVAGRGAAVCRRLAPPVCLLIIYGNTPALGT